MADFYVKYGSKNAKLIANFKFGNFVVRIHQVGSKYVLSKNRKICGHYFNLLDCLKAMSNHIEFELSDMLNL